MKKIILLAVLFAALGSSAWAQVCTPDTSHFAAGAFASPASLPCINQGSSYSATISIRIPDSVDAHLFDNSYPAGFYYVHIDSIALDSVVGAPAGIAAAINPSSSVFLYPGQYGCVQLSGTTAAAVGSYTLGMAGHGCFHVQLTHHVADSCINGLLPAYFSYAVSVCAPSNVCTPDSSQFTSGVNVYPASLPCITPGTPFSGTVSIRVPDSIDAHTFVSIAPAGSFLHIDSIFIDSVNGMPAGIAAYTNPGDSVWIHGGGFACVQFAGTTNAPAGNYPLSIHGRGCVHGVIFGFNIDSCVSGSLSAYISYSLNVCGVGCTVDTTHFSASTHVYPPSLPCITTGTPFSGQINIQIPDSIDASDFISQIPPGTAVIYVDSININTITGYPAGISSVSNPVLTSLLLPGSYACASVTGTVNGVTTPAGNYPMTISGRACGHGTFPLIGHIDTCIQNFNFSRVYRYSVDVCYPAGINQVTDGVTLNIYPNPNQGKFTVTVSSSSRVSGSMSVLDQLGRVINTQSIDVTGTKQVALDLGNISSGAYLLMINTAEGRSVKQFIVK